MAKLRLFLDTRRSSINFKNDSYPIFFRLYHKTQKFISTGYRTTKDGWDDRNSLLRKSPYFNRNLDCDAINNELHRKLNIGLQTIQEIGDSIESVTASTLVDYIKQEWDKDNNSKYKEMITNGLTLRQWTDVLVDRKKRENKPSSAQWYNQGANAFIKFNNNEDLWLGSISVSFLKSFESYCIGKGNSKNCISSYMRAVRAVYYSAINEERFTPNKNPFDKYKIPQTSRTKKRAIPKSSLLKIKELNYEEGSSLWHARNYIQIMFHSRGMNFADLVKLRIKDIINGRIIYGRSKTGEPLSVLITKEIEPIISYYAKDKDEKDFLFPTNYDGSTDSFEKYKSQRKRMNYRMSIIAKDAGIKENFTTYSIRHSWATIAKHMGIATEIISEGLGHHSIVTTESYLKSFDNNLLDQINEKVVS